MQQLPKILFLFFILFETHIEQALGQTQIKAVFLHQASVLYSDQEVTPEFTPLIGSCLKGYIVKQDEYRTMFDISAQFFPGFDREELPNFPPEGIISLSVGKNWEPSADNILIIPVVRGVADILHQEQFKIGTGIDVCSHPDQAGNFRENSFVFNFGLYADYGLSDKKVDWTLTFGVGIPIH